MYVCVSFNNWAFKRKFILHANLLLLLHCCRSCRWNSTVSAAYATFVLSLALSLLALPFHRRMPLAVVFVVDGTWQMPHVNCLPSLTVMSKIFAKGVFKWDRLLSFYNQPTRQPWQTDRQTDAFVCMYIHRLYVCLYTCRYVLKFSCPFAPFNEIITPKLLLVELRRCQRWWASVMSSLRYNFSKSAINLIAINEVTTEPRATLR